MAKFPPEGIKLLRSVTDAIPNISVITKIEILSWKTENSIEQIVKEFVSDSNIIDLDPEIVSVCIELRRKKNIKTPDAIIAATALANGLILITANEKDFQNIKSLKIINPYTI